MIRFLEDHQKEMLRLLEELVNIDSGSHDKAGVDKIGRLLKELFEQQGFVVDEYAQEDYGNHLRIRHRDAIDPKIIILAHMDTVFPKGTVKERPFRIEGNKAYGPGVIDMKGSLVSLYYAMVALLQFNLSGVKNVQIFINSDEEVGSVTSRRLIEQFAQGKKYALVMEPARKNGFLVTSRRGNGSYTLEIHGKAAHSGIEPEKGRSAIEELAHKVIQLHKLSDPEHGIHVNVGVIEGGSAVNIVSDHAIAKIDIRISEMEQLKLLKQELEKICATTDVNGTTVSLQGHMNRPPMKKTEKTEKLLSVIKEVGDMIGVDIHDTATGGGSDASFPAALGIATIDGLGPVGGNAHSDKEYLDLESLIPRTQLLAETIQRLSEK
ncbi:M20 family metallopeptidase [Aquibacillus salsiterrae]|uniref:M20 family metallopeptidase n=1 Tax=Aquibacillus salsiterrae TaxID=2950439 RepID=A0A9X3WDQ6_9BACI|nr:M20 family metallopeptidase [Aquibacillus salsiterrae]MDC3416235.1 M20 family metallopeptidase [Aquibacillus salsiterrae]